MSEEPSTGLTDKQKAFCREYCMDWNGTQAAIRVGYSSDTAREQASRLLTNVNILAFIDYIKSHLEEVAEISKLKVIRTHIDIAYKEEISVKDRQKSLDAIAKLLGYESPSKIDLSNSDGSLSGIEKLTTDELKLRAASIQTIQNNESSHRNIR